MRGGDSAASLLSAAWAFPETGQAFESADRAVATPGWPPNPPHGEPSEIALLDAQGRILRVNEAWRQMAARSGFDRGGVGHGYDEVAARCFSVPDGGSFAARLEALAAGRTAGLDQAYRGEGDAAGEWRRLQITPLSAGEGVEYVAVYEDLTPLRRAQSELRELSDQLAGVQDAERQRVAVELHDSTCQHLAALGLGLMRLRELSRQPGAMDILQDMSESLAEAVRETRVLAYLMRPAAIGEEGLEAIARRFVLGLADRTGLLLDFDSEGPVDRASLTVQNAALRVIQEALSNTYRHSGADRAAVTVSSRGAELTVEIRDNGRGSHGAAQSERGAQGVGLAGMRSRVEQLGGDLSIESAPTGVRVLARLPMVGLD